MDLTDAGFVRHWQVVGPVLQRVEREEMRAYTEADRQRDIQALLSVSISFKPGMTSGLVEQQRRYQRCRP